MSLIPPVTATPLSRLSPKHASASSETVTTFILLKSKQKNGALSHLVTIDAIVDSHRVKNTIYKPTTGIRSTTTQPYTSSDALVCSSNNYSFKKKKKRWRGWYYSSSFSPSLSPSPSLSSDVLMNSELLGAVRDVLALFDGRPFASSPFIAGRFPRLCPLSLRSLRGFPTDSPACRRERS